MGGDGGFRKTYLCQLYMRLEGSDGLVVSNWVDEMEQEFGMEVILGWGSG